MPTETIVVPPIGGSTGAENNQTATPPDGIDYLAAISALEDENKRLTTERENYRGAYLKASSKLKDKNIAPEEQASYDDERLQRIVDERLASSQLMANQQKMADLIKKMARENQELKLSSQNKPGSSSAMSGTATAAVAPTTSGSATIDQVAKARNWSPKMVERYKKNLAEQKDVGLKI